jgi:predicted Zn-dependent protease
MRLHLLTLTPLLALACGCYIEPYSEPITIPAGYVPPRYNPGATTRPMVTTVPPSTATVPSYTSTGNGTTAPAHPATTTPAVEVVIDDKLRGRIAQAAENLVTRRYPVDADPQLNEYLILVGSLLTINTPQPDVEYRYLLLKTDEPVSFAIWPRTIAVSRGLLGQMDDESELAGVLAREMSNLIAGRPLQAAGISLPAQPSTRPATQATTQPTTRPATSAETAAVTRHAAKLADAVLKDDMDAAGRQAADLEGAKFAAAAKYSPDGSLRLMTRMKPMSTTAATTASTAAAWERVKMLDANVQTIAKANPQATVQLPVRFEEYVKPKGKPDATANQ